MLSDEFTLKYYLQKKIQNRYIYLEFRKGIYRIPQAFKLAKIYLVNNLSLYRYHPVRITSIMW